MAASGDGWPAPVWLVLLGTAALQLAQTLADVALKVCGAWAGPGVRGGGVTRARPRAGLAGRGVVAGGAAGRAGPGARADAARAAGDQPEGAPVRARAPSHEACGQDEFVRWARLQRDHNRKKELFDRLGAWSCVRACVRVGGVGDAAERLAQTRR